MSPLRKLFASLLIVGMVTAGGVACGSDDDAKSPDTTAPSDTSDTSDTSEPSDSSEPADSSDPVASPDSDGSIETWCQNFEKFDELEQEMGYGNDESMALLEDLDKDAPEQIRDDMTMMASAMREMASVDFADEQAVNAVEEKYSGDEYGAMNDRIETFRADNCEAALAAD